MSQPVVNIPVAPGIQQNASYHFELPGLLAGDYTFSLRTTLTLLEWVGTNDVFGSRSCQGGVCDARSFMTDTRTVHSFSVENEIQPEITSLFRVLAPVQQVPEPASVSLLGAGLLLAWLRRRRSIAR